MNRKKLLLFPIILILLNSAGCGTMLPSAHEVVRTPWNDFHEIQNAYNKVTRNETTVSQLKKLGFDLYSSPNVRNLNYIDIAIATQSIKSDDLDGGFRQCFKAKNDCRGYEFEPRVVNSKRIGNFWLDLFSFKRKTKETGWQFKATFLIVDDVVIEKLWSGNPMILEERETKKPLGPFQEAEGLLYKLVP